MFVYIFHVYRFPRQLDHAVYVDRGKEMLEVVPCSFRRRGETLAEQLR